jgi:hypothetical protein
MNDTKSEKKQHKYSIYGVSVIDLQPAQSQIVPEFKRFDSDKPRILPDGWLIITNLASVNNERRRIYLRSEYILRQMLNTNRRCRSIRLSAGLILPVIDLYRRLAGRVGGHRFG